MAETQKPKKRKLVKKSETDADDTPKPIKTPKKPPSTTVNKNVDSDSDSGSDSESESLPKLLEPYSKDQLIEIITEAALKNQSLYNIFRDAADRDVSHRKIFVHGLGWDTTRDSLSLVLQPFGEIEDCNVVTDRVTGKAKGYGFVLFKTRRGALKALKNPRKKIGSRIASFQLASVGPVAATATKEESAGRKIYVSHVQSEVDPEELRAFFEKFGEIETGPIGFDSQTGKSRGFALFVYKTLEGAKKVLEEPYKMFEGHQLHCQKAAEGKGKNSAPVAAAPQAQAPVLAAVAAAQNLALFGQHPSLNPVYGGLMANPGFVNPAMSGALNPGMLNQGMLVPTSQVGGAIGSGGGGSVGSMAGLAGYGAGSNGLGGLGAGSGSVLGAYGTSAMPMQGLQHVYPNTQMGQAGAGRGQGAGGSFSGYPSYMWKV